MQSIVFKEHEGSFLVGLLAAQASKTGKVGFVGGMDIPLIRKFACGYVQGVKYAKKDAEVFQNMTGTTGAAWNDPVKGGELAKGQIDRGADVVYHAAGGTGIGVLRAAADAGKLGIGVDSNQNGLHPGKMLTSMVKRVDVATYNAFDDGQEGTFKAGVSVLGLKEDGVGWALDDNNKALITADMKAAADKAAKPTSSPAPSRCTTTCRTPSARCKLTSGRRSPRLRPDPFSTAVLPIRSGAQPSPAECPRPMSPAIELIAHQQELRRRSRQQGRDLKRRARHDPRHRRRERRRQIDPHVDPLRLLRGRFRRDPRQRQADRHPLLRAMPSTPASAWCTSTSCWWSRLPSSRT